MANDSLRLVDERGNTENKPLSTVFFDPSFLQDTTNNNVDRVLRGLATQQAQENDLLMVNGLRNVLFGPPTAGMGLDLMALDIQRARDHGLPSYTQTLAAYLPDVVMTSVTQISSDPDTQQALRELYDIDENDPVKKLNIDKIDLFVGALAEDHLERMSVGLTTFTVLHDQFTRLRDGDRFFFINDPDLYDLNGSLHEEILSFMDLDNIRLSDIIHLNTGIADIQENVFIIPEPATYLILCLGTAWIICRQGRYDS